MKKRKTLLNTLAVVAVILIISLGFIKYSEEVSELKDNIRRHLSSQETSEAVQDEAPVYEEMNPQDFSPFVYRGDEWFLNARLIYHACGGIDSLTYTNSREALEKTIADGNNYIEIDFAFTTDGHLVCTHNFENGYENDCVKLPYDEFMASKIYGKYTPLSAGDIIDYMRENPDLYVITDTKDSFPDVMKYLFSLTDDSSIIDRFIVQLYGPGQKALIKELYPLKDENCLLTLYKLPYLNVGQLLKICADENISVITCSFYSFSDEEAQALRSKNIILFEHTVNRIDCVDMGLQRGINGFYTDFLQEGDLDILGSASP